MSMSEANKPGQDVPEEERVVLCGANAYDKKYYFNELLKGIPSSIQEELHIICVLFTEEIGGIFTIEFDENGNVISGEMDVLAATVGRFQKQSKIMILEMH